MKKTLFTLTIALLTTAGAWAQTVQYSYYDNGTWATGQVTEYTEINAGNAPTALTGTAENPGWYVVTGTVNISSQVQVNGDVHLILADEASLTVTGGILILGNSLTIYGQAGGTGKLTAEGNDGSSGIYVRNGSLTINGGVVTATRPGSGGGIDASSSSVTINGGVVTATGGHGISADSSCVTINGGTVTATGSGSGGYGIYAINSSSVTISGGTVTVTSSNGRGISGSSSSSVTISGGALTADGAYGANNDPLTLNVSGNGVATITGMVDSTVKINHDGGLLFAKEIKTSSTTDTNCASIVGSVTPTEDFTVPAGANLTIQNGQTLTIPEGVTVYNYGTINVSGGTLTNNGTIYNIGGGTITGTIVGTGTVINAVVAGDFLLYADDGEKLTEYDSSTKTGDYTFTEYSSSGYNVLEITSDRAMTVTMAPGVTKTTTDKLSVDVAVWSEGNTSKTTTLTLDGVHTELAANSSALQVNSGTHLTLVLAEGSDNLLAAGGNNAGIYANGSLTIQGPGRLTAQGGSGYHGIRAIKDLTITNGAKVVAIGGSSDSSTGGNGIWRDGGSSGVYYDVTISGGARVTATGGSSGSSTGGHGIQCDYNTNALIIEGSGTVVTATGGDSKGGEGGYGIYDSSNVQTEREASTIRNGAAVTATGGDSNGGYGGIGLYRRDDGVLTVTGASLTAQGGNGATSQYDYSGAGIYINHPDSGLAVGEGGVVTATGGNVGDDTTGTSSSIRLNLNAFRYGDSISVTGGSLTATGGSAANSYGIYASNSKTPNAESGPLVSVTGGTVMAKGGTSGIYTTGGVGNGVSALSISGGVVEATGGSYGIQSDSFTTTDSGNAVIFASGTTAAISDNDDTTTWSGVIFQNGEGTVYGTGVTTGVDFEIPENNTLTIDNGQTLTLGAGTTCTNNGRIIVNGTLNYGAPDYGEIQGNQPVTVKGTGVVDDPYQIPDLATLEYYRDKINADTTGTGYAAAHYELTADIDMSGKYGESNESWHPIGDGSGEDDFYNGVAISKRRTFYGIFDGGGHTISGLYIEVGKNDTIREIGLFGRVAENGVVRNLTVSGVVNVQETNSDIYVGGVVGNLSYASFYSYGDIYNPTVENCVSDVQINVTSPKDNLYVGGVVGRNAGKVKNCRNGGDVNATSTGSVYAGGIVGHNDGDEEDEDIVTIVSNCYSTGSISASGTKSYAGGVAGRSQYATVSNCYYLKDTDINNALWGVGYVSTESTSDEGSGTASKTSAQFASGEVAWLLQGEQDTQIWGQTLGDSDDATPVLTGDTGKRVWKVAFMNGSEEFAAGYANSGGSVALPETEPTPTETGKTFSGWFDAETGGTQYTEGVTISSETPTNLTAYAQWEPAQSVDLHNTAVSAFRAWSEDGAIRISHAAAVQVFDATGRLVYAGQARRVVVPQGMYIVRSGKDVQKVVVK